MSPRTVPAPSGQPSFNLQKFYEQTFNCPAPLIATPDFYTGADDARPPTEAAAESEPLIAEIISVEDLYRKPAFTYLMEIPEPIPESAMKSLRPGRLKRLWYRLTGR